VAAVLAVTSAAQSPTPTPAPASSLTGLFRTPQLTLPVATPSSQGRRAVFKLFEAIHVTAEAPAPEAVEALRGKLQMISALRRGWYTGPAMSEPIFTYWNAVDYTDVSRKGYYAVPYYVRSSAAYYAGAPEAVRPDLSVGETIAAILISSMFNSGYRR
jgi:hypothetical protein